MDRRLARKEALNLLFDYGFNEEKSAVELYAGAADARDFEPDEYIQTVVSGVLAKKDELDAVIEGNLKAWKKNRLPRVSLAILRMAIYEIMYMDSIPTSVSINEAVELAKIYGEEKDASFVNGLLGSVARAQDASDKDSE